MDKCFLTGCDKVTEWQLPWFIDNYKKHNDVPLVIADFGMSDEMVTYAKLNCSYLMEATSVTIKGWMKKPLAMLSSPAKDTFWIDTDCQVLGDISGIFDYIEPNKLTMVEDRPWSKRRGEKWHNSGVVGFRGNPMILEKWSSRCLSLNIDGDQEVLHAMLQDPLQRMSYIVDLPHKFNKLRLDLIDNNPPKNPLIMHWTGHKGNLEIKRMING